MAASLHKTRRASFLPLVGFAAAAAAAIFVFAPVSKPEIAPEIVFEPEICAPQTAKPELHLEARCTVSLAELKIEALGPLDLLRVELTEGRINFVALTAPKPR